MKQKSLNNSHILLSAPFGREKEAIVPAFPM